MTSPSSKFSLNWRDAIEGLLYAALCPAVLMIATSLANGQFKINWTEEWHTAAAAGATYLLKTFFSGPTPPSPTNGSAAPKVIVLFLLIGALVSSCGAQSLLKPLPLYRPPVVPGRFLRAIGPTDSLPSITTRQWQGLRLAGPDVAIALPDLSAYTGLGIDYVWATANQTTFKWDYDYTIGLRVRGGANLPSPGTVKAVGALGLRASFLKGLVAVELLYNLTLQHAQGAIGNPAAFIPGLN